MHQQIEVRPSLPEPIARLAELAGNMWFSWNAEARSLLFRLDRALWRQVGHNPVLFLRCISQRKLEAAAKDRTYLEHYNRIMASFDSYASDAHTWYSEHCTSGSEGPIAYFSAEFGVHESLPIFSGGLGVLAGDHCKSASDIGLPLVGVGLLYRKGYFIQHIDGEGQQQDLYEDHDFSEMPVRAVFGADGKQLMIPVEMSDRTVLIKVWEARVGRNPLYLLDADIPENQLHDRLITHQLYGGDMEMRICQEIILGIGGVRALTALGIDPVVWHMNEGHSVFLGLERIRQLVNNADLGFYEALEAVRANTVFTTHTPVAAGHDAFPLNLKDKYFKSYWEYMGLKRHEFMELGLEVMPDGHEVFSLTVLALNLSSWCNGVSRLHGEVSSTMWQDIWPGVPPDENPISYITNGVHTHSWLAPQMMDLFDQHLGIEWRGHLTERDFWDKVDDIPDSLFWGVHQDIKCRMIERIRERVYDQFLRNGEGSAAIRELDHLLDPDALTIGFARRFATYKRATLIFADLDRLDRIVNDPERPVQLVFSGKAHPADIPGQKLIARIYEISRQPRFRGKVVLVEGYDISLARYLVSGVDIWLNTPRRPHEASGTSGMKAAMNGVVNFSVRDGWWCEAVEEGENGWSIGDERDDNDERLAEQDALSLYQLLETEIIPRYYARNVQGLSESWINVSKGSVKTVTPLFNTDRMVGEYATRFYFPAAAKGVGVADSGFAVARDMAKWKAFVRLNWHDVQITWSDDQGAPRQITYGEEVVVRTEVKKGAIPGSDIRVEAYIMDASPGSERREPYRVAMQPESEDGSDWITYRGVFMPPDSGRFSVSARVIPYHPELAGPHETGLVTWLDGGDGGSMSAPAGATKADNPIKVDTTDERSPQVQA
ncbi:MAG: alpha-glucan family phosphorylase [Leptospirillia bacterium]